MCLLVCPRNYLAGQAKIWIASGEAPGSTMRLQLIFIIEMSVVSFGPIVRSNMAEEKFDLLSPHVI